MMQLFTSITFILMATGSYSQINLTKLNPSTIPKSIHYNGKLKKSVQWIDSIGKHIVIATETGENPGGTADETFRDAALYAAHYLIKGDTSQLIWKVYDFVKECPVDIQANFIDNAFQVTDLNNNGKAEVWLMYKIACRGDVSPGDMKIIMYEEDRKFAVRGTTKVKVSEKGYAGGEYKFDEAFTKGPEVFRKFAKRLWQKHLIEAWE